MNVVLEGNWRLGLERDPEGTKDLKVYSKPSHFYQIVFLPNTWNVLPLQVVFFSLEMMNEGQLEQSRKVDRFGDFKT